MASGNPVLDRTALDRPAEARFALPGLVLVLLVAFAAGGGGSLHALANLTVQLAAIGVLAFHRDAFVRFWREASLGLRIVIVASLALPLVQIIPLPESVWTALPGRELVVRSLERSGGSGWMPLSVDPLRTLLALTALITPLAVLIIGWAVPRQRLLDIGWLVVALGIVSTLMGVAQLGSTTDNATLFGSRHPGEILLGTFANRNSTGLFLGFALGLVALLPAPRPHPAILPVRLAFVALLLVAIILTKSRTALVLAAIPIGLGVIRALWWQFQTRRNASASKALLAMLGIIALVGAGTAVLVVAAPGRVSETIERFEAKDDPRRFIWDDATYAAGRYWPAGAGMGTFDEIFQLDESLENMTRRRAGRAHNDYIEIAIEAGLMGLVLVAAWVLVIGWLSWCVRSSPNRWAAWAGSAFLLAIALQSITDYPLRNQTILAFAGFALLLLARIAADQRSAER
jgi:exopolysaccharide production protein ExoQ